MDIFIIGAGAIGRLFAAFFQGAGLHTAMLCRAEEEASMLETRGFNVKTLQGTVEHHLIPTFSASHNLPISRVIMVCVKAHDTEDILPVIPRCTTPGSIVVSMQNGLGNLELLSEVTKPEKIFCATTAQGSTRHHDGSIEHCGTGVTRIAPFAPSKAHHADMTQLQELFTKSGLNIELHNDCRSILWSKLAVNCGINPVTAIHGITNGELLAHVHLLDMACKAASEAAETARRMNIELLFSDPAEEVAKVALLTAKNTSSMLQDLTNRKSTEIREINGHMITQAERAGVDPAVNRELMRQIVHLESKMC